MHYTKQFIIYVPKLDKVILIVGDFSMENNSKKILSFDGELFFTDIQTLDKIIKNRYKNLLSIGEL